MWDVALEQLERWGLTADDAERAGLFVAENVAKIYPDMAAAPAIVIPYFGPDGMLRRYRDASGEDRPFVRVRWLTPRTKASSAFLKPGKGQRYDQPPRSGIAAYFPPLLNWAAIAADPAQAIVVTEGEAKALCACRHGIPTIALGGVFSFMTRDSTHLLPELEAVTWRDRDVYLVFDSDAATNPQVMAAEGRLADELQRARGAKLRIVRLPAGEGGAKVGLDDYLVANGVQAFSNLCRVTGAINALDVKILRLNAAVAWIEVEGAVYDIEQKEWIQKGNFTAGSHHSANKFAMPGPRGVKQVNVAQEWLTHPLAQRFTRALFRPGEGRTVMHEGRQALNMWDGFQHATPGDITPFLKLTKYLFQNMPPEHRDLCLRLLAYKARNPQRKIPLAIVMVGLEGSGKSVWGEIVCAAFESYGKTISAEQMVGKFNGTWAERSLVALVDEAESSVLADHKEKVRALISQQRMMMEEKFRPQREINNYTFFIFNSNRRAIASYGYDDRRMIVVDIPPRREPEFYQEIFDWKADGGPAKLMHYFLTVDIGDWQPPATAPGTAEKAIAYAEGLTPIQQLADDMRHSDENAVFGWIAAASAWATQSEGSNNPHIARTARIMINELPNFQIRPYYTAAELVMLFPLLQTQAAGSFKAPPTAGEVSRALREAGIPYLQCADNPAGFMVRGRLQQYLVISDFDNWKRPITQAQFDAAGPWPTFSQIQRSRGHR